MIAPSDDIRYRNSESIFESCSWFYALCRERLFTDHTEEIVDLISPLLLHKNRMLLLEVGCGPGFYSLRLATRFPSCEVVGVDPSERLLARAKNNALRHGLENCRFILAEAQQLQDMPEAADFVIASRLFLILENRRSALKAIYTSLRPNGLLFIAEPLSAIRSALPMTIMRTIRAITRKSMYDDTSSRVLNKEQFREFIASQPWKHVRQWSDDRYQYALCEKPA
jgi:arsenite methyltransferase